MNPPCVHCKVRARSNARSLCRRCRDTPAVAVLYPPKREHAGVQSGKNPVRPATAPTGFLPGSWQKIAVMMQRATDGESIFHPKDARA